MTKLRILRWGDDPGLSRWPSAIIRVFIRRRQVISEKKVSRWLEDGAGGHESRDGQGGREWTGGRPLEGGRGSDSPHPRVSGRNLQPGRSVLDCDLQNYMINLCGFKALNLVVCYSSNGKLMQCPYIWENRLCLRMWRAVLPAHISAEETQFDLLVGEGHPGGLEWR